MAKFHLPKLNSWVTFLVLTSIGLHGLVLALPMPSLVDTPPEELPELTDPEVIQVVTLPKLATGPENESTEPPFPELPEEEPPPEEESELELDEERVLSDPEILEEVIPEPEELDEPEPENDIEPEPSEQPSDPSSDQQNGNTKYGGYNGDQVNNFKDPMFSSQQFGEWEPRVRDKFSIPDKDKNGEDNGLGKLNARDLQEPFLPFKPSDCLMDDPSEKVILGIVLDADDMLIGEPTLLSNSGYTDLDNELIEFTQGLNYAQNNSPGVLKPYWFSVPIEHEKCE